MNSDKKMVLVYAEDYDTLLKLIGLGLDIKDKIDGELCTLILGSGSSNPSDLLAYGADTVYLINVQRLSGFEIEAQKAAVLKVVENVSPDFILLGATKRGKELAARLAAALETGCMNDCLRIDVDGEGRLTAERLTYGGSTIAYQASRFKPHVASVLTRGLETPEPTKGEGKIVPLEVDVPQTRIEVLESREKSKSDVELDEAPIIVSAGRGFKKKEDLELLEELSDALGAKIGCSRPIAADMGWMDEWVGISGVKVQPKLYIACGISGTIQHMSGMRDSRIIVSINKDESANINDSSDYYLVGDLYEILPKLTEALRRG